MANSKRRCALKSCKKHQLADTMITNGVNAWCNDECRATHAMEAVANLRKGKERQAKAEKKKNRAELKAFRERDHSYQFNLTKREAQGLANDLDRHLPCICCDAPRMGQQFCGGHFKTGKAHPELALSLLNIHGQRNKLCNEQKSANINGDKHSKGYKQGLIDRYGQWIVDYLEGYHPPRKYTCEELIAMRKLYAAERRRLKSGLPPSRDWRAVEKAK